MFSSTLLYQIRQLVSSLNKKNFNSNKEELKQLISLYGEDAQVYLIKCLVEETDALSQQEAPDVQKLVLLGDEIAQASTRPNFVSLVCQAFGAAGEENLQGKRPGIADASRITQDFISNFCRSLKLNLSQQLSFAIGLAQSPNPLVAQEAYKYLKSKLQDLSVSGTGGSAGGRLGEDGLQVLHSLLCLLRSNEEYISNPQATSTLIKMLKASYPEYSSGFSLLPLMDEENSDSADFVSLGHNPVALESEAGSIAAQIRRNSDMASFVRDLGYGCTASTEAFREAIKESGVPMDERQAASLLCLVARPQSGLVNEMAATVCADLLGHTQADHDPSENAAGESGQGADGMTAWDLDVMSLVLREYPNLDWRKVAMALDHPLLGLEDQKALKALMTLYRQASGESGFPVDVLFRPWENKAGHLSFLKQAIAAPPEVFSFEGSPRMQAAFEEAPEIPTGPPNKAWMSVDLIATMLSFADTSLWYSARSVFETAVHYCPETLLCGLALVETPTWNKLRVELLSQLIPNYFRPAPSRHTYAMVVIKRIQQTNPKLLVEAFVEMFKQDESPAVVHNTLSVMLALPSIQQDVLSSACVEFVVALAVAAADKDQLNLEKFLGDKLAATENKEAYAKGILNFLQRHAATARSKAAPGEPVMLSTESMAALLKVLQSDPVVLHVLSGEIKAAHEVYAKRFPPQQSQPQDLLGGGMVVNNNNHNPNNHTTAVAGSGGAGAGGSSNPDVIEEMANSYFQKIYTSEQSIAEVIEMLKRFKTSKDLREQEIFSCMIRNLFDEYRFFHKYPEKELRITGILFGTLIQHQLVSSLTLGVALRYVLEALRRPPGNGSTGKWFRFGMFALEQFKARLPEWPQYCSHIVQIPHLRQSYPELVAEIERTMSVKPSDQQVMGGGAEMGGQPPMHAQLQASQQQQQQAAFQTQNQQQAAFQAGPQGGLRSPGMPPYLLDGRAPDGGLLDQQQLPPSLMPAVLERRASAEAGVVGGPPQQQAPKAMGPPMQPGGVVGQPPRADNGLGGFGPRGGYLDPSSSPTMGPSAAQRIMAGQTQPGQPPVQVQPPLPMQQQQLAPSTSAVPQVSQQVSPGLQPAPPPPNAANAAQPQAPITPHVAVGELNLSTCIDKIMPGVPESIPLTQPPDNVVDRIYFVINNVSAGNLDAKAGELREVLKEDYHNWLANYLVQKRISSHANLHGMYMAFIDKLDAPKLTRAILSSVLQYVSKLLRSHKIISNTGDRSVLKNLGSFLGQMTIARNRPLLHRQLDVKELLYHGYETGRLFALTPFVAKILECAEKSKVFRPPNPWVMGLMGVLAELYQVEDLKINIKFEIDLLCKRLDIKLQDVPQQDTLGIRIQPKKEKNPDFNVKVGAPMASPPQVPAVGPDVPLEDAQGELGGASTAAGSPMALPQQQSVQPTPLQADGVGGATSPQGAPFQDQTVIPNLAAYVQINPQLTLFSQSPQLRRMVPVAVDRAIREIIQPVVERSVTIACITTKELVVKDFAMEPDENRMRKAAHLMVSSLAGSLALVTCKEPLRVSIGNHLRGLLAQANVEIANMDSVVQLCATDNLELGCMLIEKAATEKAMRDIDEALSPALQHRRKHREQTGGQPFYDMSVLAGGNRFPTALPELLRPKPGGLSQSQVEVYEAFQRTPRTVAARPAPGATGASTSPVGAEVLKKPGPEGGVGLPPSTLQQVLEAFDALITRLEQALQTLAVQAAGREISISMLPVDHEVPTTMREIVLLPQKLPSPAKEEVMVREAQAIFKMLYDGSSAEMVRLEALVAILEGLGVKKGDLLTWLGYVPVTEVNHKLHRVVLILLLRSKLLKINEVDLCLAKNMDAGRNAFWIEFSIQLVRQILIDRLATYQELPQTLDILQKSAARQQPAIRKEIVRLVEEIRLLMSKEVAEAAKKHQQQQQVMQGPPQALQQQQPPPQQQPQQPQAKAPISRASPAQRQERQDVTHLLEHWIVLWNESPGSEKAYLKYFNMLQQYEVTKSPDQIEKFIRLATDVCVEACLKNAVVNDNDDLHRTTLSYTIVDAYAKLLYLLVKYNGDVNSRINILQRILKAVVSSLKEDPLKTPLDPRPYFRLFVDLLHDFNSFDPTLDANNIQVLTAFAIAFNNLQPSLVPAFAFAWLELISHRMFMPALLLAKGQKGWILMHRLLMDLFSFMEPFLRKAELNDPIRILYKGTLRVLLVLLHDFPEFLCDYHVSFCDVIPPTCIQLRNLILSAFPRNMRLPDPFTPNLKVDLLPDISQPPRIPAGYTGALLSLKQEIDTFLKSRQPPTFLQDLPKKLCAKAGDGQVYNTPAINALVIYVGTQAIVQFQNKATATIPNIASSTPMEIFQELVKRLDAEGRYLLLNAIANQLRYPNNQTHYFSCVLLYLFAEASSELIKEQITRVLLERLIVHRPHPWGLLITFIELIKNPRYNFWAHSFTRCAVEIERVFESVARSCMGQGPTNASGNQALGEETAVASS